MNCTHCKSKNTKKNGHTHYGKQNYYCNDCLRQFVEDGQDWFVSEYEKQLIDKLLLERISLAGICRVMDVSEGWLMSYIKELYANTPEDLNIILELPDKEVYLADRFDEEIIRLQVKKNKKAIESYTKIDDFEEEISMQIIDNEGVAFESIEESNLYDSLEGGLVGDLLMDKLYSKERGKRVEFMGIQLDEMCGAARADICGEKEE